MQNFVVEENLVLRYLRPGFLGRRQAIMEIPAAGGPRVDPAAAFGERKPIVRHNLHDAIVTRVRDMIIEGTLAPGTRVHEGHLGQELGVSRTPLREALKYLASEGLLELAPGRGAGV